MRRLIRNLCWGLALLLSPALCWLVRRLLAALAPRVVIRGRGRGLDGRKLVALTLDDGPSGAGSLELLALLRGLDVPATLFLIGGHLSRGGEGFVAQALAEGHQIGNHMADDSTSARLPPEAFLDQLRRTAAALRRAAAPRTLTLRWFRPGRGWFHGAMLKTLHAEGYRLVLGSVFPFDTSHPPLWFLRRFLLANVHPGAILVLHDRPDTIAATLATLRTVVPELRRRGYRFVTLDDLIDERMDADRLGPDQVRCPQTV
ncbi:polysaccharide deacetylase family protein [Cyanobium sp. CH-040]|uniref:polysaccharide deacetylase family protein n=1 Tax=Cyanobium sp. CH-040 TaxID=2823708 RepID=UPI0020CE7B4A|nr:polysaccharide deacetylase family protein [Cyanobium sp. CH-040]MCP9927095.1 polysaccharide deacetylase family protein [Cyanobium sp. CH-040]